MIFLIDVRRSLVTDIVFIFIVGALLFFVFFGFGSKLGLDRLRSLAFMLYFGPSGLNPVFTMYLRRREEFNY